MHKFPRSNEEMTLTTEFQVKLQVIRALPNHPFIKIKEELDLIVEYHNKARQLAKLQSKLFKKESAFANYLHHLFLLKLVKFAFINNPYAKLDDYGFKDISEQPLEVKIHYKDALDVNEFWNAERFPIIAAYEIFQKMMQVDKVQAHEYKDDGGAARRP